MTMIKVFKNNFEYIACLTSAEIKEGEVFCSNFIPSAFFPKDVIDYFFDKKEHISEHRLASDKLWKFGKLYLKELKKTKVYLAIEFSAIKTFVEAGLVHKATKNFEASLSTRQQVIDNILYHFENINFLIEPTPYIFRLIPPDVILLDVDNNKTEQTVQGLYLEDKSAYEDFKSEFNRLLYASSLEFNKDLFRRELIEAKSKLKAGIVPNINVCLKTLTI